MHKENESAPGPEDLILALIPSVNFLKHSLIYYQSWVRKKNHLFEHLKNLWEYKE